MWWLEAIKWKGGHFFSFIFLKVGKWKFISLHLGYRWPTSIKVLLDALVRASNKTCPDYTAPPNPPPIGTPWQVPYLTSFRKKDNCKARPHNIRGHTWQVSRLAEVVLPCCRSRQAGVHLAYFNIPGQLCDRAEWIQRRLLLLADKREAYTLKSTQPESSQLLIIDTVLCVCVCVFF